MIKNALQNSCAKGCMVYVVALVLLVVFTSMGLGGLSARLGGSSGRPQASALTESRQPAGVAAPQSAPAASGEQPAAPSPTTNPAIVLALPTIQIVTDISVSVPAPGAAPASTPASAPAPAQPQAQPQGGEITGDASPPFYIVQAGDTLWSIAVEYGVGTDGLRGMNNLPDDIIKPGQLLYLPQPGQPQQPAPTSAPAQPPPAQDQGNPVPAMPQTGINSRP